MTIKTKIAIILPNNVWFCPYVSIYTNLLKNEGVSYDIISWNRDGVYEDAIQYNYTLKSRNPLMLLWAYTKFASFVKRTIKERKYERLIVFTPQAGLFLYSYLRKNFKKKYIFDYRDLSLEQKSYFKRAFVTLLRNSFANVISSPGFKKYLPKGFNYLLSHNFSVEDVRKAIVDNNEVIFRDKPIDVLTIGGIRDYESNMQVIEHLANVDGFTVRFVGKGPSAESLQRSAQALKAKNVYFEGYYPKEKERDYVAEATFLNIFYPRKASHDTALSNRFYNSLIYGKPMITTANTTQGDYASTYGVGLALESCDNLPEVLKAYLCDIDVEQYLINRKKLLKDFLLDYIKWESVMKHFLA